MTTSEQAVMRNGRSSSQVSIYDYPEHLNPFYEDENHKRLRFWKLGNKKNGDSRRGSFSMAGLKEMWAFKSFRLKKKSSSLGINKTSESPPPLRRNIDSNESHYGTYDPRMRHATGVNTLNGFERNSPYRSSLQDMRTAQDIDKNGHIYDIGFMRNDRYRSTIQTPGLRNDISGYSPRVPTRRYVYGGSVTPQPSIRSNFSDESRGIISRGSSQLSVSSTNPFDEDEDDVVVGKISTSGSAESKNQSPTNRPPRKKRRAPPPPIPVPKIIIEETSSNPATPSTSQTYQNEVTDSIEITNLTAEIENFVKTKTDSLENDVEDNHIKSNASGIPPVITVEVKETSPEKKILPESKEASPENESSTSSSSYEAIENESIQISPEQISLDDNLNIDETFESANINTIITIKENNETGAIVKQNIVRESKSTEEIDLETVQISSNQQDISTEEPADINDVELKITESKEDLSIKSETSNETIASNGAGSNRFQISYVPLKDSSPEAEPELRSYYAPTTSHHHHHHYNHHEIIKEPNEIVSYERRRSVKEIIESINRSQSLLKVSQEQIAQAMVDSPVNNLNEPKVKAPPRKKHEAKENMVRNLKDLNESEHEINRMIREMENSSKIPDDKNNIKEAEVDELIEKLTDKLNNNEDNNNEIFKKCAIKKDINRESSPTSSNLDWNPVPKPKRTKNLSPELIKIKIITENVDK